MKRIIEHVIRLRTWLVNLAFALLIVAPEVVHSPEILAR